MIDHEGSEQELRRWQKAEEARDGLQAELDRLDALERAGRAGAEFTDPHAERRRLDDAIQRADVEIEEAEIAFHRALGEDSIADNLEVDRLERHFIAEEAAESIMGTGPDEEEDEEEEGEDEDEDPE